MWPDSFNKDLEQIVSRETIAKLETYHALLVKWQRAINLVSPKTLDEAWVRHFADSAQVVRYIPGGVKTLVDLGSGAGFAGMVMAILRPDIKVHLVESDARKAQFLRSVSRDTATPVSIHAARIEAIVDEVSPDLVSARALADLPALLGYMAPWAARNPALVGLFLKGAKAEEEIAQARKSYNFEPESFPSLTDPQGSIVRVARVCRRQD